MGQEHLVATVQSNEVLRTWIKSDKRVEERLLLKSVPYQNGALISINTSWDWFQRTDVLITARKNL